MIRLYDYYRSSASYRVRIALNLKGLDYDQVKVNLLENGQMSDEYRARNPQGLVPFFEHDDFGTGQSLAIIDYIETVHPDPALLPADPQDRARVMAFALAIACDIHPLNNLRVLKYLKNELGRDQEAVDTWYRHWVVEGFTALEKSIADRGSDYLYGDRPGLADICLVPQVYNARRFDVDMDAFPRLKHYDAKANALEAFQKAHPDNNQ